MSSGLKDLETPCLVLDERRLDANILRMQRHVDRLKVPLRPHLKTPKSLPIAHKLMAAGAAGFNVSTLNEAEYFHSQGIDDLFYCVPTSPKAAKRAASLAGRGCKITVMTDTAEGAGAIVTSLRESGAETPLRVAIEIDVDGYRSGAPLEGNEIEAAAGILHTADETQFAGIMSYGGVSYELSEDDASALADRHCDALAEVVARLSAAELPCEMVSFGSTPAVLHARSLPGVTEARCGIYVFQDLMQAGIRACREDDIAVTVLTTVTARHPRLNRLVIDAGALALSKDRSTMGRPFDASYGWVCDPETTERLGDLRVQSVSQELGLVTSATGKPINFEAFPVGTRLRVLPNHADMTAAAYDSYHVVRESGVVDCWSRTNGWDHR